MDSFFVVFVVDTKVLGLVDVASRSVDDKSEAASSRVILVVVRNADDASLCHCETNALAAPAMAVVFVTLDNDEDVKDSDGSMKCRRESSCRCLRFEKKDAPQSSPSSWK